MYIIYNIVLRPRVIHVLIYIYTSFIINEINESSSPARDLMFSVHIIKTMRVSKVYAFDLVDIFFSTHV